MKRFSLALLLAVACNQHPTNTPQPTYGDNQVVPQDVVWTQLVNATANGATLTKSGGQPWLDDAGAVSAQSIGAGDGWLEITVGDTQPFRVVGLARPHAGTSAGAIDFAFRLQAGRADVYESGAWQADNTVVSGDTLRVAVASGIVTYSKNGNAIYTSTATPQYPLAATASLIDAGAAINGARVGINAPTTTGNDTFVTAVMAQPTAAGNGATVSLDDQRAHRRAGAVRPDDELRHLERLRVGDGDGAHHLGDRPRAGHDVSLSRACRGQRQQCRLLGGRDVHDAGGRDRRRHDTAADHGQQARLLRLDARQRQRAHRAGSRLPRVRRARVGLRCGAPDVVLAGVDDHVQHDLRRRRRVGAGQHHRRRQAHAAHPDHRRRRRQPAAAGRRR